MPSVVELSYEQAIRALDLQERGIDQLRNRAGVVLTAAAVTASFLGAQTIQHTTHLGILEILALASLAGSICLSIYVLLPKRGFVFSVSAPRVYERLYGEDPDEARRQLLYWLEDYWSANQDKIVNLGRFFFAASMALVFQFVFWSWALIDRIS
jgi:hypothetical protein